ncbi:uncharacterized protein LOC143550086 [Bidens hawaiensis]|uniref:uncharacterized protein LOC143550086 n=1 Tax=Bidens hawaiensis TaxID=980011 RepID=UPI00404A4D58
MFCFPSTLSGFHSAEENVSGYSMQPAASNRANFQLLNGSIVSCSLESKESVRGDENDTSSVRIKSNHVNDFSSQSVQISHPLLDWGQKYLHFPSLAYLTVENRHKSSVLNVFEPYSTNRQFYPCNQSKIKIGPGEIASLCFVFLPKWLGLSSAHIILQTSSGGFLIRAQGFAVQPPYMLQSSGSSPLVISLANPSKEVLHLKEVSARMSFSSGNVSYMVNGVCSMIDPTGGSDISVKEWLDVKLGQLGQSVMAIRPQKAWTVGSNSSEPILEVEFQYQSQTNVFGSFCVQLLNNASRDNSDTIVFEAEFGGKSRSYYLDVLMPCDVNGTTVVSLLVENDGPDLLTVVKISTDGENIESLQTKYVEGLILFPHTVTQVAMITYTPNIRRNLNCKLVIYTNKSDDPDVKIPCSDFAGLCSRSQSYVESGSIKVSKVESDESVLGNWRSHGTKTGMSVLDDHEVTFPVVLVGYHHSKWIEVVNPSDQPVAMQLLLNSGEVIDECLESDENFQTLVLNSHANPSRYGFSIPHNALTEAYVHPHGKTVLGPVIFQPSGRCSWKSSALVRNNLSGVGWLSLHGSGGLVSMILHDGSGPVHSIELKHNFGQPFMKVLFAKNTGDLPVKVDKITVSGTKCELDGLLVGSCKGFVLQPGESRKIIVSYRAETCAETVLRDLELGMVGGILVVPVKVSLPKLTIAICKRSLFWIKFKKFVFAGLVSIILVLMACSFMFSVIVSDGNLPDTHSSNVCLKPDTVKKVVTSSLSLSPPPPPPPAASTMAAESPKPENLVVNIGKDKARRRKKKRSSGNGLTGYLDGPSSQSSNSTPSSPLSPIKCFSPSQHVRARSPFHHGGSGMVIPVKEKPSTPPKAPGPFDRAPGPKRKAIKPNEKSGCDARFEYNILDCHLQLRDSGSFEVGLMSTMAKDDNFVSLFEMSPQQFLTMSRADNVSCKQND